MTLNFLRSLAKVLFCGTIGAVMLSLLPWKLALIAFLFGCLFVFWRGAQTMLVISLLASSAYGQFGGVQQPMFSMQSTAAVPYSPTNEPYIRYWWVASDVATNTSVTNWVDRIQGAQLTNTAALAPTNSATGVGFDGGHYLKSKTLFQIDPAPGLTGTVVVCFTPVTPAASGWILAGANGTFPDSTAYGLVANSAGNLYYWGLGGNGVIGPYASGTTKDIFIATSGGAGTETIYTNAVIARSGVNWNGIGDFANVGFDNAASQYYIGKIQEIIVYYALFNATSVSNVHWYFTNTYSFSP